MRMPSGIAKIADAKKPAPMRKTEILMSGHSSPARHNRIALNNTELGVGKISDDTRPV